MDDPIWCNWHKTSARTTLAENRRRKLSPYAKWICCQQTEGTPRSSEEDHRFHNIKRIAPRRTLPYEKVELRYLLEMVVASTGGAGIFSELEDAISKSGDLCQDLWEEFCQLYLLHRLSYTHVWHWHELSPTQRALLRTTITDASPPSFVAERDGVYTRVMCLFHPRGAPSWSRWKERRRLLRWGDVRHPRERERLIMTNMELDRPHSCYSGVYSRNFFETLNSLDLLAMLPAAASAQRHILVRGDVDVDRLIDGHVVRLIHIVSEP